MLRLGVLGEQGGGRMGYVKAFYGKWGMLGKDWVENVTVSLTLPRFANPGAGGAVYPEAAPVLCPF